MLVDIVSQYSLFLLQLTKVSLMTMVTGDKSLLRTGEKIT